MSYARFGPDSDIYVYLHVDGYLHCCACLLPDDSRDSFTCNTTDDMITHLRDHATAGHRIPDHTRPALERDRDENDRWIADELAISLVYDAMRAELDAEQDRAEMRNRAADVVETLRERWRR